MRDKATAIKVVVRKSGNSAVTDVSIRADIGSYAVTQFYVSDLANIDAQGRLRSDNGAYPLSFGPNEVTKTVYFFGSGFAPATNSFQATVTVDHLQQISETDETNNHRASAPLTVVETSWTNRILAPFPELELNYVRADWDEPLTLFESAYVASTEFVEGVFPVSAERFSPNRSSDKLSTTGFFWRGGDDDLNGFELLAWMTWAQTRLTLANPRADQHVVLVPPGWFSDNTTVEYSTALGTAHPFSWDIVIAEVRTGDQPNANVAQIVAHELGHAYGLWQPPCEEYDADCNGQPDRLGILAGSGIWVDQRMPIQTPWNNLTYCLMGQFQAHDGVWIDMEDYSALLENRSTTLAVRSARGSTGSEAILAIGTFDVNGNVMLGNWYVIDDAESTALTPGPYKFRYYDESGNLLSELSFDVPFSFHGSAVDQMPFAVTIPYIPSMANVLITNNDVAIAEKTASQNAPTITILSPNGSDQVQGTVAVRWSGSDLDGDPLSYAILYSSDAGIHWETIAIDLPGTTYQWDTSHLPATDEYLLRIIATDGLLTGEDTSDSPFEVVEASTIYLPLVVRN